MALRSNIPSAPGQSVLTGVTASAGEVNYNDITTVGTVQATKAVIVDGSKDVSGFNDVGIGGDLTVTGDVAAATGTIANLTASSYTAVARTATADGLTTGIIAAAGSYQFVAVTSAGANNIIVLPAPTPGTVVELAVGANGYELRSSAPATVLIGSGAGGASVESAIPANSVARLFCVDATHWVGYTITAATLAAVEAAG
jgi:hypothetical protein